METITLPSASMNSVTLTIPIPPLSFQNISTPPAENNLRYLQSRNLRRTTIRYLRLLLPMIIYTWLKQKITIKKKMEFSYELFYGNATPDFHTFIYNYDKNETPCSLPDLSPSPYYALNNTIACYTKGNNQYITITGTTSNPNYTTIS